jgi:hypothetical protein
MDASQTILGTVNADGTLSLADKVTLPAGQVRVTVETLPAIPAAHTLLEVLDRIHRHQAARGYRGRSQAEIDAELSALRDEWEDRLAEIERLQQGDRRSGD